MNKIIILTLLLSSCATKTIEKDYAVSAQPSFSGMVQNSGIINFNNDTGYELSNDTVNRYRNLCEKYNKEAIGLSGNYLDNEGMVQFLELVEKNKND